MIRLSIQLPNQSVRRLEWNKPVLRLGRSQSNDVVVAAENVSGQHAQIVFNAGRYSFRDLRSTNGSMLVRRGKRYMLRDSTLEMPLELGDRLCLASMDNALLVEAILEEPPDVEEAFDKTILAEQQARPADLEVTLGQDSDALRIAVRLARELSGLDATRAIGRLACQACLGAFPQAQRASFLVLSDGQYQIECIEDRDGRGVTESTRKMIGSRLLLDRCLAERKGYLFLFEQDRVQAVATRVVSVDPQGVVDFKSDRVLLCCPLLHNDQCYGFLEVEAPLAAAERQTLSRRDLSLATLMGHLVAARLSDLEAQKARLKLVRKATAGFMAATVGHCFKNLLFVPMSLSKMLPLCLQQGKMQEVQWMLARNGVSIRYLDILSNEFAAASKDPNEGFADCHLGVILREVAELVGQIAPDRIEARLAIPEGLPRINCHDAALKRLLMNLTLNAVDALFEAPRTEKGCITLEAAYSQADEEFSIVVADNGPGMPERILENLRSIFRQVQSSTDALGDLQQIAEQVRSTKDQGLKEHYGLGFLFVCLTIQQHQGRMEIDSSPAHGARFTLSLPARRQMTLAGA